MILHAVCLAQNNWYVTSASFANKMSTDVDSFFVRFMYLNNILLVYMCSKAQNINAV